MDISTISSLQYEVLAVLFAGILIGKFLGVQSAILTGFIVLALLAPTNFPILAMSLILLAMIAKWGSQWISWL